MTFIEKLFERAKMANKTIVLPESNDRRVAEAAAKVLADKIAGIVLIGKEDEIKNLYPDLDLSQAQFVHPDTSPLRERFNREFYELRKHKGISEEDAAAMMSEAIPFGIMLLKAGLVDGLVAGAAHSTADTLRPALQILKTKAGTKLVSSSLFLETGAIDCGDEGLVLVADPALVVNPDSEELAEIAISTAESYETLTGREARVAMLSYSTLGSGKGESVDKVVAATQIVRKRKPELAIEGEIQADSALVPSVAAIKAPGSKVAGRANCLIFPDLNSANIGYKLVQRLGKAEAYGPLLQGIAMPVNDLSRGASAFDIVGVVALTAVQSDQ